jgi:hypothetical protein
MATGSKGRRAGATESTAAPPAWNRGREKGALKEGEGGADKWREEEVGRCGRV